MTGHDNAGDATTLTCPYQVTYNFSGFAGLVNSPPTINTGKAARPARSNGN